MDTTGNKEERQDTYPNAGRDSGYTDEQGRAIGENIINRVTELMIGPQTKMIQLAAQLDATVQTQDQRFQYVLNQLGAFLEKEDARHSVYDASEASTLEALTSVAHRLDEITSYVQQSVTIAREALTVSKAVTARLGKLQTRVDTIDRQHGDQIKDVFARLDRKREIIEEHAQRLGALETEALSVVNVRLAALEEDKKRFEAVEVALKELAARIGDALPAEEDQGISAQLRIDAAERAGDDR